MSEIQKSSNLKPRFFYGYIIVTASFFIFLVAFAAQSVFGTFFKPVLEEFNWSRTLTSGGFSLAMFISGVVAVPMGWLNDRFGPRLMMCVCGLLMGAGYLLMATINADWQLYLYYGLIAGSGIGGVFVILPSTIARWFVKRRGMMTGIALAGTGTGALAMPTLASWIIYTYDWRISFLVLGIIFLVIVIIASQFIKRDPSKTNQLPYGYNSREKLELQPGNEGLSFGEALKTRGVWLLMGMSVCFGLTMFSVMVHIIAHATDIGIPAMIAATIMIVIGALDVTGRVTMGSVADKIGNRLATITGFVLISAALFWLVAARELWGLYLFAVLFGLGYSSMGTAIAPLTADVVGLKAHGSIYGLAVFFFQTGGTIGPLMVGYLFDIQGSYNTAFIICGCVGVAGIIITFFLKSTWRQKTTLPTSS